MLCPVAVTVGKDVVSALDASSTIDPMSVDASSPELVIIGPDTQVDTEAIGVVVAPCTTAAVAGCVSPGIVAISPVSPTELSPSVAAAELAAPGPSTVASTATVSVHRCDPALDVSASAQLADPPISVAVVS